MELANDIINLVLYKIELNIYFKTSLGLRAVVEVVCWKLVLSSSVSVPRII